MLLLSPKIQEVEPTPGEPTPVLEDTGVPGHPTLFEVLLPSCLIIFRLHFALAF